MENICSVYECNNLVWTRGLCLFHYNKFKRDGTILVVPKKRNVCSVNGCYDLVHGEGFCSKHYRRFLRNGHTNKVRPETTQPNLSLLPSDKTKTEWLIWAAGFFDGEGCVMIAQNGNKTFHLKVMASQKYPEPLLFFQALFGGSIYKDKKRQDCRWNSSSNQAANAIRKMLPYLFVKRRQAELALKFQDRLSIKPVANSITEEERQIRREIYLEIKRLNHL